MILSVTVTRQLRYHDCNCKQCTCVAAEPMDRAFPPAESNQCIDMQCTCIAAEPVEP